MMGLERGLCGGCVNSMFKSFQQADATVDYSFRFLSAIIVLAGRQHVWYEDG
jgi:hypothetical protein